MAYNSAHTGPQIDAAVEMLGQIQSARDATAADRDEVALLASQVDDNASQVESQAATVSTQTAQVLASAAEVDQAHDETLSASAVAADAKDAAALSAVSAQASKDSATASASAAAQSQLAAGLSEQMSAENATATSEDRIAVDALAQQVEADSASAALSAQNAAAVVTGGTATLDPSPGKIPLADAQGKIDPEWLGEEIARTSVIQGAIDTAQSAKDSADLATARSARFMAPASTPPVIRDDGAALQLGDRYVNTGNQAEYIYKTDGWALNDSLAAIADLEDGSDPAKGAALIPYDQTSAGEQILLSRKLSNYSALRAYTGSASHVELTQTGISGKFARLGIVGGYADNGGTIIIGVNGDVWVRQFCGVLALDWFQPDKTGLADAQPAVDAWFKVLGATGGSGFAGDGKYSLSTGITTPLTASFSVTCSPGAEFIAASGFPGAGVKMVGISTGINPDKSFKWIGGRFNSQNQPYDVAYANDTFSVNATNCTLCRIEIDSIYSGADFTTSGSDSHIFVGGPSNIFVNIGHSQGAKDQAVYISGQFSAELGHNLHVHGNFDKCRGAVIVKRRFKSAQVFANVTDCITGVADGTADIAGKASANAGYLHNYHVTSLRTEHSLFLNASSSVQGFVNAKDIGVSLSDYVSPSASAARFRGASNSQVFVDAHGVNPLLTTTVDFVGAFFGPLTTALDGTLNAVRNLVNINCSSLGAAFVESGAGTDNNRVTGKHDLMLNYYPAVVGSTTSWELDQGGQSIGNKGKRVVSATGSILYAILDDGSTARGPRTGSGPSYHDDFTGQPVRAGRTIVTAGTTTADQGLLQFNYGEIVLNSPFARCTGVFRPGQFTLTTLPNAALYSGGEIDVTNATGGSKRCRSNATVWQILNTTTTVS